MSERLPQFDHRTVDAKWQKRWRETSHFRTPDPVGRDKVYVLDMFPYPSGEGLHVGHPLGYIGSDIVARFFRAQGKAVLHPMGFDAFGLPAENYAIKTGVHPGITTAKAIERYRQQLQLIGLSYDWDREISSCDPSYYRWTQWLFLQLFKSGLAYRAKAPVNWCPHCQTVLANEQVKDGKCERCDTPVEHKDLEQWFFKITEYADELIEQVDDLDWPESIKLMQKNWIGRSQGALLKFEILRTKNQTNSKDSNHKQITSIEVFTTRPDTLYGATYIVLAPEHPLTQRLEASISNKDEVKEYLARAGHKTELERKAEDKDKTGVELKGISALNPATKETIPIWVADYVLGSYGTGAIMAVPAHDERDFEFAKKFNLPVRRVVEPKFVDTNGESAVKEGLPFVKREAICAIVRNPADDTYLCISWKGVAMNGLVTGGIDLGEDLIETAKREIREETGYKNLRLVADPTWTIQTQFYHRVKKENRHARFHYVFLELEDDERDLVDHTEASLHDVVWKQRTELKDFFTVFEGSFASELINNPNFVYTGSGAMINSQEFNDLDTNDAKTKITASVGGEMTTSYRIRDWLVSRQRYWGAPIPVIYCDKCPGKSQIPNDKSQTNSNNQNSKFKTTTIDGVPYAIHPVPEDQLPVLLPDDVDFKPTGQSPLIDSKFFHAGVICPECGALARREVDTLDTFVDSSWYFLRYVDPHNRNLIFDPDRLREWLPVDWYVGGAEHAVLHLLYARFVTKALADLGLVDFREPFVRLRNQGLIGGEDGRKMSKRWGNVVNPDDVVRDYGADALRAFEMFMGPFEDAKPWSSRGIIGVRRWLDRVWKLQSRIADDDVLLTPQTADELTRSILAISQMIADFKFNTVVSQLMILTNALDKETSIPLLAWKEFLELLAPIVPHIASELWERAGFADSPATRWPKRDQTDLVRDMIVTPVQINGKTKLRDFSHPASLSPEELTDYAGRQPAITDLLSGKKIVNTIAKPGKILNFVVT